MGIKLGDLVVKRNLTDDELNGKIITIDGYNHLYQFLSSIRTPEGHLLTNSDGRVISHLKGIFSRSANLLSKNMKIVYVFDGLPHPLKKNTLDQRRERKEKALRDWEDALARGDLSTARTKAQQTTHLTEEMVSDTKTLLELMGIPYIQAPGEGEAQAAIMVSRGDAFASSSQDYDSLLFGADRVIRNLGTTGRRKLPGIRKWVNVDVEMIDLAQTLDKLRITREQLIDMSILMGTDFNPGYKGIGPKTGLKLIKEYGDLETLSKKKRIPLFEWDEVRRIFIDPDVTDDYSLDFLPVDNNGVEDLLVGKFGFNPDGVKKNLDLISKDMVSRSQFSLDSFI